MQKINESIYDRVSSPYNLLIISANYLINVRNWTAKEEVRASMSDIIDQSNEQNITQCANGHKSRSSVISQHLK